MNLQKVLTHSAKDLAPVSFAAVMATGIVSIAAQGLGFNLLAQILFIVNVLSFLWLSSLWVIRFCLWRPMITEDLDNPHKVPGFLTLVAGTNVLANQSLIVGELQNLFFYLGLLGLVLWSVFAYLVPYRAIVSGQKTEAIIPVTGAWLLLAVATQSVSVFLSNYSALRGGIEGAPYLLSSFIFFLLGGFFYFIILGLVVLRLLFYYVKSEDLMPPYWICLGAAAISTMAGANLLSNYNSSLEFFVSIQALRTLVLSFWVIATWWAPLLVALGFWKYFKKRDTFHYIPQLWSVVFPLGMYAASTRKFGGAIQWSWMESVAMIAFFLAVAAWVSCFTYALISWCRRQF